MSSPCADSGGGSPSLALKCKSVPENQALRCFRNRGWVLVGQVSGEIIPARCQASFCPWCGPLRAREVAGAIGLAEPERLVRLSGLRASWRENSWRIRQVVEEIRAAEYVFEYCVHCEWNPKETGYHAHLYQVGCYVPQAFLQSSCVRHGLGYPDIRKFTARGGPSETYGLKLAGLDYGVTLSKREECLERYLEVNGGRLSHQSRGFFRDASGKSCGLTEARAAWRSLAHGGDGKETWALRHRPDWDGG